MFVGLYDVDSGEFVSEMGRYREGEVPPFMGNLLRCFCFFDTGETACTHTRIHSRTPSSLVDSSIYSFAHHSLHIILPSHAVEVRSGQVHAPFGACTTQHCT